jgi:hypothetical protein
MYPSITRPISPPKKQHILHFDGRAVMQTAKQLVANLDERIESSWEIKWLDRLIEKGNAVHDGKTCQWLYNDMVMDALGNLMPCCFEPKKAVVSVYGNIDDAGDHSIPNIISLVGDILLINKDSESLKLVFRELG